MSIFGVKREIENDEADVRILKCLKWTHPDIKTLTEAEIKNKHDHLYPPCLTTEGNPFLAAAEGRKVVYTLRHRTFDVRTDIDHALMKGFIGVMNDATANGIQRFFITKRGNELITPKKKGEK